MNFKKQIKNIFIKLACIDNAIYRIAHRTGRGFDDISDDVDNMFGNIDALDENQTEIYRRLRALEDLVMPDK